MIANLRRLVGCAGLIAIAMGAGVPAARAADADAPRVVTKRVTPEYPVLARKVHAVGKVKLSVVVTLAGKVKKVEIIGGHPLLVVAASDAAMQWLFAPASKESSELLVFDFSAPE
jgi:outer membrane biosynthesis protein TonB